MKSSETKQLGRISGASVIAVLVTLVNSGYYRTTATDSYIPLILLITVVAFYCGFNLKKLGAIKINSIISVLLIAIALSILTNLSSANILSGGRVAVTLICAYMLSQLVNLEDFIFTFSIAIKAIIVLAFFLNILVQIGIDAFPRVGDYFDLFFITMKVDGSRSCGIFWEPGVFASIIIITMLFEFFVVSGPKQYWWIALYVVGILLTKSTAGLMLLMILLLGLLWKKAAEGRHGVILSIFFAIMLVVLTVYLEKMFVFLAELNPSLFGKLVEIESETTSTRLNAPLVNLSVFFERPVFGWGFTGSSTQILEMMENTTGVKVVAQTSTSTQLLAAIGFLGIVYSLAFLYPIFDKKKLAHLDVISKIIIAICMLLIVNKEPHIFILATWMMLFYMNQERTA